MSGHISRRAWLGTVSGVIGSAALVRPLRGQQYHIAGADFKLGVASYSFRKFSRARAIEMTKQLGTPYLNVKEFHLKLDSTPQQIDAAKQEFQAAGIVLVGCGNVDFQEDDESDIRSKFEYAKRAGFPLVVCAPTHATLPKLEKFVKEYDIKIAVHNHGPRDKNFPTPQSALKMVKDMDPRCGLCMDLGHTALAGVDIVEAIQEAGTRLLDMHAKDLRDPLNEESWCPVGEGKLPFPQIFRQLLEMKYSGCVNLENESEPDNPLPGMQKSFAFMRGVLADIQAAGKA
ncbi:MAG: sugar phosphate isomerase/epimerase [Acidobacteriaceae bacterium]|nr:sugar phosphate isomerase/epimerase [Acidobacteriaceae bacterium]MBV9780336.1 sugar phosphate isomerase/epimerase [Acidobacteriaceae bacterium]